MKLGNLVVGRGGTLIPWLVAAVSVGIVLGMLLTGGGSGSPSSPILFGAATDPAGGYQFALDVGGKVSGFFQEMEGVGSQSEVIEQKVTDPRGTPVIRLIPGRLSWGKVLLRRGITAEMDLWKWRKMVEDGNIEGARTNASIIMMNRTGKPVAQWDLNNVWVVSTRVVIKPDCSQSCLFEEVELASEREARVK